MLSMQTSLQSIDFPRQDDFLIMYFLHDTLSYFFQGNRSLFTFILGSIHRPINRPITIRSKNSSKLRWMSKEVILFLQDFIVRTILRQKFKCIIRCYRRLLQLIEIIRNDRHFEEREKRRIRIRVV